MAATGRIERRLAAAIVLTALIPLLGAVYLAKSMVSATANRFFVPEIGARLDESIGLYQELARAEKNAMRSETHAMATEPELVQAVTKHDAPALERALDTLRKAHPDLVSLGVVQGGKTLGTADRGHPVDETRELTLEVRRPIAGLPKVASSGAHREDDADDDETPALVALFAADKARFDRLERMTEFVDTYGKIASRRKVDEQTYLAAFAALLGVTIALAIGVGILLARDVSKRIVRLAEATRKVGAGDLSTRVEEAGSDEVADLARAFNRMLAEVETTRARIEYLQRIGAWQEMARRLAHEIKNPLTPIQLAVEEIHQRYSGTDAPYRKLLDATLEVVEAEVSTLRRLVGEFSDFARLPEAHLEPSDLVEFLRERSEQSSILDDGTAMGNEGETLPQVTVSFDLPKEPAPAALDKQMLRRALINLIRNAAQALRDAGKVNGRVQVSLCRSGDFWAIDVDDDGPGIPAEMRERIFDPYVTTKGDGTGLGLAIVKKVVVEHGGGITALTSPLGGARLRVTIPVKAPEQARSAKAEGPGAPLPQTSQTS
jgi:two-component system nitrogen regulation sensor histidine kinase NtrY